MLIGYVSDERYVALAGVEVELIGSGGSVGIRSRASGRGPCRRAAGPI